MIVSMPPIAKIAKIYRYGRTIIAALQIQAKEEGWVSSRNTYQSEMGCFKWQG